MLCLPLIVNVNVCGCVTASPTVKGASKVSWYSIAAATEICNSVPLLLLIMLFLPAGMALSWALMLRSRSSSLIGFLGPVSYLNHYYWLRISELIICAALKIGETLYTCRTCKLEYNDSMDICENCYPEESEKHAGHEMVRLAITRVTNMPDDKVVQLNNWWRCSSPGCNAGASLSFLT